MAADTLALTVQKSRHVNRVVRTDIALPDGRRLGASVSVQDTMLNALADDVSNQIAAQTSTVLMKHLNSWITSTGTSTSTTNSMIYNRLRQPVAGTMLSGEAEAAFFEQQSRTVLVQLDKDGKLLARGPLYLVLEDGTEIDIQPGRYEIREEGRRVKYRATTHEFNRFVNASDLMADFLSYLASIGVRRAELKQITIDMFVSWLIIAAAEKDQEEKPQQEVLALQHQAAPLRKPRCRSCGQFIARMRASLGVAFCSGAHMDRFVAV